MRQQTRFAKLVASGFGAGHLPVAPGTWGSLVAILCVLLLHWALPSWERTGLWLLTLLATVVGIPAATRVSRLQGEKDPSLIVIDEIAGQFLALAWFPVTVTTLVLGFLLFRFLDILKPFPARQSEGLPGGWGIMMDDLIAGAYTALILFLVRTVWI